MATFHWLVDKKVVANSLNCSNLKKYGDKHIHCLSKKKADRDSFVRSAWTLNVSVLYKFNPETG